MGADPGRSRLRRRPGVDLLQGRAHGRGLGCGGVHQDGRSGAGRRRADRAVAAVSADRGAAHGDGVDGHRSAHRTHGGRPWPVPSPRPRHCRTTRCTPRRPRASDRSRNAWRHDRHAESCSARRRSGAGRVAVPRGGRLPRGGGLLRWPLHGRGGGRRGRGGRRRHVLVVSRRARRPGPRANRAGVRPVSRTDDGLRQRFRVGLHFRLRFSSGLRVPVRTRAVGITAARALRHRGPGGSASPSARAATGAEYYASEEAPTGDRTRLRIDSTGMCMGIPMGSGSDGVQPRESTCTGAAWQDWDVVAQEQSRKVVLRNAGTGKCLSHSGTTKDGAFVRQAPCVPGDPLRVWTMKHRGDGAVAIFTSDRMFLGLKKWAPAARGEPHDSLITTQRHYYASPSLHFRTDS
ncbi:RICIN domain-containing protein [Streptomyces sp. NPDC048577]|uniref:RICIN domain-containing protein n=1 Tax=Streptomyces sp. NPDC048577 TaxID=3157209 RepID=UPI0034145DB5